MRKLENLPQSQSRKFIVSEDDLVGVHHLEKDKMDEDPMTFITLLLELLDDDDEPNNLLSSRSEFTLPTMLGMCFYRRSYVPRIENYMGLTRQFWDEDFRRQFRIRPRTFNLLVRYVSQIPGIIKPHGGKGRPPVSMDKQLLLTLKYLGTQETYHVLAEKFNLSPSTCSDIVKRICIALCQVQGNIISWPSDAARSWKIQQDFHQLCGLYGIIGAIDGSHVEIKPPGEDEQSYYNRKKRHSVVLQGVCDGRGAFTDVYAGWPGSCHDTRVLRNSPLFQRATNNHHAMFVGNTFIIGDPAYAPTTWLAPTLKPTAQTTALKKKYSTVIAKARVVIENAFCHLKVRWRRLKYIDADIENIPNLIVAACVLHNICILEREAIDCLDNGDDDQDHGEDSDDDSDSDDDGDGNLAHNGAPHPAQVGGQQLVNHLIALVANLPP